MERMPNDFCYKFTVLGRYPAKTKGSEPAVTVNVAAGERGHLVFAGTLTMGEDEARALLETLEKALGDRVALEDQTEQR
jgi:NADPH-dependent 2,4-dienoyl-CoA reductase/sulfur reductase-like enzyme